MRIDHEDGTVDPTPRNQLYLQSSWDLFENCELDLIGRYVDLLENASTSDYFTMDLRYSWRPNETVEWYVVGRNLLDGSHPEFKNDPYTQTMRTEVPREVFGGVSLRY